MTCKQCLKEGLISKLYPPQVFESTLMSSQPFYDESGVYHDHDGNTTFGDWSCSNGHKWTQVKKSKCPSCDWGS